MTEVHFDSAKHEYRDGQGALYPSVTTILKFNGKYCYGNVSDETRKSKMDVGTAAHWVTQLDDQGALNPRTVPIKLRPYRKAWASWKRASGFVPKLVEHQFIDFTYGYAGTVDRFGLIGKSHAVVDLKTGTQIAPATRWQLVAYAHHLLMWPCRLIAVRLLPDATYRAKEFPLEMYATYWAEYLECLRKFQTAR